MKNRKKVYAHHVTRLEKALEERSNQLKSRSLTGKKRRLDPQFRHIEGRLKQYKGRLVAIENMEKIVQSRSAG